MPAHSPTTARNRYSRSKNLIYQVSLPVDRVTSSARQILFEVCNAFNLSNAKGQTRFQYNQIYVVYMYTYIHTHIYTSRRSHAIELIVRFRSRKSTRRVRLAGCSLLRPIYISYRGIVCSHFLFLLKAVLMDGTHETEFRVRIFYRTFFS